MVSRSRLQLSDHAHDLVHLFERRRAIIDSAIMRFLKKEKEMSLDNIANKVLTLRSTVHSLPWDFQHLIECLFLTVVKYEGRM